MAAATFERYPPPATVWCACYCLVCCITSRPEMGNEEANPTSPTQAVEGVAAAAAEGLDRPDAIVDLVNMVIQQNHDYLLMCNP